MKTTQQVLDYLQSHPWLKKGYAKLNKQELTILTNFLDNSPSDLGEAQLKVNKMFMDYKGTLPKRWSLISELASSGTSFRFS